MQVTEWYPAEIKPVRVGYYETIRQRVLSSCKGVQRLYWNGFSWNYPINHQYEKYPALMPQKDGDVWRGLAEPAK